MTHAHRESGTWAVLILALFGFLFLLFVPSYADSRFNGPSIQAVTSHANESIHVFHPCVPRMGALLSTGCVWAADGMCISSCPIANCTASSVETVRVPYSPSDGFSYSFPVVHRSSNGTMMLALSTASSSSSYAGVYLITCDEKCMKPVITTIDSMATVDCNTAGTDLAIGPDGRAIVSYFYRVYNSLQGKFFYWLKVGICENASCGQVTTYNVATQVGYNTGVVYDARTRNVYVASIDALTATVYGCRFDDIASGNWKNFTINLNSPSTAVSFNDIAVPHSIELVFAGGSNIDLWRCIVADNLTATHEPLNCSRTFNFTGIDGLSSTVSVYNPRDLSSYVGISWWNSVGVATNILQELYHCSDLYCSSGSDSSRLIYNSTEGGQPMPGIFVYVDSYFKTVFTFYQTFEGILYANINGEVIVVDDGSKVMTTGLPGWAITLIAIGCVLTVILLFFGLQRCCMLRRSRYQFM